MIYYNKQIERILSIIDLLLTLQGLKAIRSEYYD